MFSALAAVCTVDCAIEIVLITLPYITLLLQFGPSLLPRELMLRLGSDVVVTTTGRVQQHAASLVLETARCAGGDDRVPVRAGTSGMAREPGCTAADLSEVNVLLEGLQSSSVALREVSIQVMKTTFLLFLRMRPLWATSTGRMS